MSATFLENGFVTIQGIYWSWEMTQFYVCDNCKMSVFNQSSNVKEVFFCILQMLRMHTGLRKWNKMDKYHILLRKKNPLGINWQCIKIAKNEVLFEKYRMALKRYKDGNEIQGGDAIKHNRIFLISC